MSSAAVICSRCFRFVEPEATACGRCGAVLQPSYRPPWLAEAPAVDSYPVSSPLPSRAGAVLPDTAAPTAEADQVPESALPIGTVLAMRYRVEAVLGSGGMGVVYRAIDQQSHRRVALKLLDAGLIAHSTALRRMRQEADALRRVDHAHVVALLDTFDHGAQFALVLEYVAGGTLTARLSADGLPWSDAAPLLQGILAGLQAVHDAGLVHRDLKPDNILLTAAGVPKVADLGVARDQAQGSMNTRLGARLGTPHYMSPEQAQGLPVAATSDVFSFGILLFQIVTGRRPFVGRSEIDVLSAIVHQAPDFSAMYGRCPPVVVDVVAQCLEKDPAHRFASAKAVARCLQTAG